jgi:methylated-DNA-[protein]-cysteine S-methyltransferase
MTIHIKVSLVGTATFFRNIAWDTEGIVGVQLLEIRGATQPCEGSAKLFPQFHEVLPPAPVRDAIARIEVRLGGKHDDLGGSTLALLRLPAFHRAVYQMTRVGPSRQTVTYWHIAGHLGEPDAARAVGPAHCRNAFESVASCHRVLATGKRLDGLSAGGYAAATLRHPQTEGTLGASRRNLFDGRTRATHTIGFSSC